MATGGSTNHTLHLIAIARSCGVILNWDDFDAVSNLIPLLAKVYPNGSADVNAFEACGGLVFVIKELLKEGLLFERHSYHHGYRNAKRHAKLHQNPLFRKQPIGV